jgi:hypothetical protein
MTIINQQEKKLTLTSQPVIPQAFDFDEVMAVIMRSNKTPNKFPLFFIFN